MNKNKVTFILHKPQLSENIGACARAIKNFNFQRLYLIDPKPIFPNDKILATSDECSDPQSPPGQADKAPNKSVSAKNSK